MVVCKKDLLIVCSLVSELANFFRILLVAFVALHLIKTASLDANNRWWRGWIRSVALHINVTI